MKLCDLHKGARFKIAGCDGVFLFDHIDGMYSYCFDKESNAVHPAAWTEVEPLAFQGQE